ncbi:hypothetical protein HJG60_010226 [Phyllostomus discolor]|uniref:Uncharacterized protein n=1 Tax=Phyllostomus discolor TaxID=89673 RepID=A0A834B2C4_9CHIR|nr:hypothetical protein HJG60_010226 [Phyllostomus discolor]
MSYLCFHGSAWKSLLHLESQLGGAEDTNAWVVPVTQHVSRPWVPAFLPICFNTFPSCVSLVPARHSDSFSICPDPFGFSDSAQHLTPARVSFLVCSLSILRVCQAAEVILCLSPPYGKEEQKPQSSIFWKL